MKNPRSAFLVAVFCVSLIACSVRTTLTNTSGTIPASTTSSSTPIATSMLAPTASSITALEAPIKLTKIKQWVSYSLGVAWFANSGQFVMHTAGGLDIYNTTGELVRTWDLRDDAFHMPIILTSDNKYVVLYSSEGIQAFDIGAGKFVAKGSGDNCQEFHRGLTSVFLNSNSAKLFVGFSGNNALVDNPPIQVGVWDIEDLKLKCEGMMIKIPVLEGRPDIIDAMDISPDKTLLVLISTHNYSGEYQGWVTVWDTQSYTITCEVPGVYAAFIPMVFMPAGGLLGVVSNGGDTLSYWDVEKCVWRGSIKLPVHDSDQKMAFTPNGKYLLIGRENFQIFNASTGALVFEDDIHITGGYIYVSISPNGKYLITDYVNNGSSITTLWNIDGN